MKRKKLIYCLLTVFSLNAYGGDWAASEPIEHDYVDEYDDNTGHNCYIFGYGGYAFDFNPTGQGLAIENDGGYLSGGGIGTASELIGGSRFEIEGLKAGGFEPEDFLINGVSNILPGDQLTGSSEVTAVMVNLFKTFGDGPIQLFIGGGLGYSWYEIEMLQQRGPISLPVSAAGTGLAYQGIVGADFRLTDRLSVFTQYKYFVLPDDLVDNLSFQSISGGLRLLF